jgi:predicted alpha-1,6-mannanase (GH76 family)
VHWRSCADQAYQVLVDRFWDSGRGLFRISTRSGGLVGRLGTWHYWWQAHALDCVLDAVERGRDAERERADRLVRGILARNGGTLHSAYYDDQSWMALAMARAAAAGLGTEPLVAGLWADIRGGWDAAHGGIRWRRGDTYTNAPTNGPAAILAARRYRVTGDPADLEWARRITSWLDATLVEPGTGVVWDGIHPERDPAPNRERYSYNQGTVAMANQELAALTGDPAYREVALRVARAGLPAGGGMLPDEGGGDRALFKGIYARYAAALGDPELSAALATNGAAAWSARGPDGLSGPSWTVPPGAGVPVELSAQLSAVLLLGGLARGDAGPAAGRDADGAATPGLDGDPDPGTGGGAGLGAGPPGQLGEPGESGLAPRT